MAFSSALVAFFKKKVGLGLKCGFDIRGHDGC